MLRDSVLSMLSTGVRLLSSLALFVVLAHLWGPAAFGVFMYPYAIAAILVRIADYGFALQVARDVGREPARTHEIVGRAIGAKLVLLVPSLVVGAVVAERLPAGTSYVVLLALLLGDALIGSFALFLNIPLRALGRFDREASVSIAANLVFVAATVSAVAAGAGPVPVAAIFVLARLVFLALAWRGYADVAGGRPCMILDRRSLSETLTRGFPYAVHMVVGAASLQVDTLMIQHFMSATSVGFYQAGMRLLFGALLVGDALHNVFFSSLARVSSDARELGRLATRMTRYLVVLGVISFACFLGGHRLIVHLLYAEQFAPLADLLPLFGMLVLVRYSGLAYGAVLTLADRQGVRMLAASGVLTLHLVLGAMLIPRFGIRGALVAAAISDLVLHLVCAAAAWAQYRDGMIDRRAVVLLLLSSLMIPSALHPAGDAMPRLVLAAVLVAAALAVGVTGDEWRGIARRLARRVPGLDARAA